MASKRALTRKRDELIATANTATELAVQERHLADAQHNVARQLEDLADNLIEQVSVAEAELEAEIASPGAAQDTGKLRSVA